MTANRVPSKPSKRTRSGNKPRLTDDCLPLLFGDRLGLSGLQKELIYLYDLEDLTVLEVVAQAINRVKNSGRGFTAQYLAARAIIDEAIADQGMALYNPPIAPPSSTPSTSTTTAAATATSTNNLQATMSNQPSSSDAAGPSSPTSGPPSSTTAQGHHASSELMRELASMTIDPAATEQHMLSTKVAGPIPAQDPALRAEVMASLPKRRKKLKAALEAEKRKTAAHIQAVLDADKERKEIDEKIAKIQREMEFNRRTKARYLKQKEEKMERRKAKAQAQTAAQGGPSDAAQDGPGEQGAATETGAGGEEVTERSTRAVGRGDVDMLR